MKKEVTTHNLLVSKSQSEAWGHNQLIRWAHSLQLKSDFFLFLEAHPGRPQFTSSSCCLLASNYFIKQWNSFGLEMYLTRLDKKTIHSLTTERLSCIMLQFVLTFCIKIRDYKIMFNICMNLPFALLFIIILPLTTNKITSNMDFKCLIQFLDLTLPVPF